MNFSLLEEVHKKWRDIIVIGKTIEHNDSKYHIIGMTLSDEAKLYIIEPYIEPEHIQRKGIRNNRRLLKEDRQINCSSLNCCKLTLGNETLQINGGTGGPLRHSFNDYECIQLFFDMMSAGWTIPNWLKNTDWCNLQLVTLNIANRNELPAYSSGMPITITHGADSSPHIVEKTVTLNVGKIRSFCFTDHYGDNIQCHINSVALIDVWKNIEEQLNDPKLTEQFSAEQLEQTKRKSYQALKQCCPKGTCYIGIEYECSKDYSLIFHSKQYLKSRPEVHKGSSCFLLMHLKPDKKAGIHGLPLKGCTIDTPVSPDTCKIPAELFLYYEKINEWSETIESSKT